eukprot:gene11372-15208_t
MSALFSPITLRGLTLPNRIVISPMCQYSAVNGAANEWHVIHLGSLALSGAFRVSRKLGEHLMSRAPQVRDRVENEFLPKWLRQRGLANANLPNLANVVADILMLPRDKVFVTDVRADLVVLDILVPRVELENITGKHVLITAGPTQENIDPV